MPGRYEMVDEPEAMEVVDDDVYHPELTVRDSATNSLRSLEPIIAGPIGLKTIFYDPRWSTRQRKCCLGIIATVSICCLAILISLMVGLGKVISYINQNERMKLSGLYMVPNLADHDSGIFLYNLPSQDARYKTIADSYIKEIDEYLNKYFNQTSGDKRYVDCKIGEAPGKNKLCRFKIKTLGTNCTKENHFGYYDGSPCILFTVRNVRKWVPDVNKKFLNGLEKANLVSKGRKLDEQHLPLACAATMVPGFNTFGEMDYFEYYPEQGFETTFLKGTPDLEEKAQVEPLMFVQLPNAYKYPELHIKCSLLASNIQTMNGLSMIKFEFNNIVDVALDSIEDN